MNFNLRVRVFGFGVTGISALDFCRKYALPEKPIHRISSWEASQFSVTVSEFFARRYFESEKSCAYLEVDLSNPVVFGLFIESEISATDYIEFARDTGEQIISLGLVSPERWQEIAPFIWKIDIDKKREEAFEAKKLEIDNRERFLDARERELDEREKAAEDAGKGGGDHE
jgi:hypothetical protein